MKKLFLISVSFILFVLNSCAGSQSGVQIPDLNLSSENGSVKTSATGVNISSENGNVEIGTDGNVKVDKNNMDANFGASSIVITGSGNENSVSTDSGVNISSGTVNLNSENGDEGIEVGENGEVNVPGVDVSSDGTVNLK